MTDRQKFHETFDALRAPDDVLRDVVERTAAVSPHSRRRPVRIAVVAACLVMLLTITILADTPDRLVTHANAQQVFQREWQKLEDLGAFVPDLEEDSWRCHQDDQTDHFLWFHWKVDPNFYFYYKQYESLKDYNANVSLDPDTGKITAFGLEAYHSLVQPDWVPVKTVTAETQEAERSAWDKFVRWLEQTVFGIEPSSGEPVTLNWYDHYEVLFDLDMTAGDFGEIWSAYAGYDSFEVLGTDPDLPIVNELAPTGDEVYFAFRKTVSLQPDYVCLSYLSTAMSMCLSLSPVTEADLPEEIVTTGYQYGYLLRRCNQELETLYHLGVFAEKLQFDADDYAPANPNTSGVVCTNWKTQTKDEPYIRIRVNPATDQILHLWVTTRGQTTILREGLTLGELCEAWVEYDTTFIGYELPEGAADTPVTEIDTLPEHRFHEEDMGTYYPIRFYEAGKTEPVIRYLDYIKYSSDGYPGGFGFSFGTSYPKG